MDNAHDQPGGEELSLEWIRQLAELMAQHDLSELDLRQLGHRIRLCRGPVLPRERLASSVSGVPAESQAAATEATATKEGGRSSENVSIIKSPMVGTFYSRPNPDAAPYVKVGDHVGPETVVCIIEAMKVFNEISAEVSGRVIAILVENEEPVEYGKPLFKIDTSS